MTLLQIEHGISDFDVWKEAFDRDPIDRRGSGVRGYRVFQPVDDDGRIGIELEFDDEETASSFLDKLRELWQSPAAPVFAGKERVRIVEQVASEDLR
jgi:hypothetical protein